MPKDIIEKLAEAPAVALEGAIESTKNVREHIIEPPIKEATEYWRLLGPGLTTGAADDDPSGIATYSQTGAQYGFQLLWLAGLTFPLMAVVQEMCARIGLVTGKGLAANIRQHFHPRIIFICTILLVVANVLNLGADLGAMAKATQLLYPDLSFGLLVIFFAVISLGLQIFTTYEKYARYLKWLALILFSYVFTAFLVPNLDWSHIFRSAVLPTFSFNKEQIVLICAILGTTISPYLFFWQTAQEVEEKILEGKTTLKLRAGATDQNIRNMRIDVWSGMLLSNLVMFFIILTCGATLNAQGITNINTAADAAEALRPLAGQGAYLLFALGIIGTGMLAIPVLAGSVSYAIAESLGWKYGLYQELRQASSFYGVIIIAVLIGLLINFTGFDPIKALIYSALANGLVAPIVLVLIVLLSSNKKIMGRRVNSRFVTGVGWVVVALMVVAGIAAVISLFM